MHVWAISICRPITITPTLILPPYGFWTQRDGTATRNSQTRPLIDTKVQLKIWLSIVTQHTCCDTYMFPLYMWSNITITVGLFPFICHSLVCVQMRKILENNSETSKVYYIYILLICSSSMVTNRVFSVSLCSCWSIQHVIERVVLFLLQKEY